MIGSSRTDLAICSGPRGRFPEEPQMGKDGLVEANMKGGGVVSPICTPARPGSRRAVKRGTSFLLEPIMKVEVVTPEDYTGSVIGDLNSRRGQIQGQDMRGNANVINAMVPLANMFS